MSKDDVRRVLGPPSKVIPGRNYTDEVPHYTSGGQWIYSRFLVFGYVNIAFDRDNLVAHLIHEEF